MDINKLIREELELIDIVNEDLRKWFKQKWVNIGKKVGGKHPKCGTSGDKQGYAKCVPASKAASMSKKDKKSATRRKRTAQNKANRGGKASSGQGKKPIMVKTEAEKGMNEKKYLNKQLLSKIKSGKLDKKIAKKLDNLVTRGNGFVVVTKSKKNGYNRFHANRVDDSGIEVVPHMRDFRPGKVKGMMRHKPEHAMTDINWKGVKDIYMENTMKEARGSCWVGYQQIGMKDKGGKKVPNCVKEEVDIYYEENGKGYGYTFEFITDKSLQEAEYQGRKVKLNKIMQGDQKKFKVYVKNPKGNVVKVNFGQGGKAKGGTMRIRKSNPGARKSFRARHNCDNPGPKHKARYWACRTW